MTPKQRYKQAIKERVQESNFRVSQGLPPDPWVTEFRQKNNRTKATWKAVQPKIIKIRRKSGPAAKDGLERELMLQRRRERRKQYKKDNPEKIRQQYLNYRSRDNARRMQKRKTDPSFRIAGNLRKRLSFLLRAHAAKKTKQTLNLLGCSMCEFLDYLQSKFQLGMSFSNYGMWHIDHIRPCNSFDLTNPDQQAECFHYSNLQPLWAADNRRKSDSVAA
jgi:hypothetical protein